MQWSDHLPLGMLAKLPAPNAAAPAGGIRNGGGG